MNRATATRANQRPSRAMVLALAFGFSAVGALFTAIGVLIYYILLWQPAPTHQSH